IAKEVSSSLAKKVVVADVDGRPWDLTRPLEGDCALKLFSFEDAEGKEAFWHSSAHLLGQALELEFGVDLTIGPALEEGFYYDCYMGDRRQGELVCWVQALTEGDRPRIEKRMEAAAKEGQRFERVVVSRDEALAMFQENKFKVEIISSLPADAVISLYRVGPMVDLCTGPHLPNTTYLKLPL
ncbi:AA_TRNA_LIGASE_II domain-containing protein, partial [Haematococcus lacustris]